MITTARVQQIGEETGKALADNKITVEEFVATARQFDHDEVVLFSLAASKHLNVEAECKLMTYLIND